jgi:hypothetical protein
VPAGSRDFRVPCFPAFWELELATGKSPLPADKNVGATRANGLGKVLFARMVFGLRPYGAVSWQHSPVCCYGGGAAGVGFAGNKKNASQWDDRPHPGPREVRDAECGAN